MKTIILLGELGKRYGRRHVLDVRSPAEAIRALCANFKDFAAFMSSSDKRNVGYRVLHERQDLNAEQLTQPASKAIVFVPVVMGAASAAALNEGGAAAIQIFLGAALIAVGVLTGQAWLATIGFSMMIGGASQMLVPMLSSKDPKERKDETSYVFDGAINTQAQGQPVPLGYGRLLVGSAVVSAGIITEEID